MAVAADQRHPWADNLARAGFIAKGVVYLVVGGLAFVAALGLGGEATDASGLLFAAAGSVMGRLLIGVVAVGLVAHATFRAALTFMGEPYAELGRLRGVGRRIANGFSALSYFGLAATGLALAVGRRSSLHADDDDVTRHWSARILGAPWGRPLLITAAAAIAGGALFQLGRAFWRTDIRRRLRVEDMSSGGCRVVVSIGRFAFFCRATVFTIVGYFLARAAIDRAPREARGPGGAIHAVWEHRHGNVMLALMATGLVAVGIFALLEARWRRLFTTHSVRGRVGES